jgi:polyhydroxyalkanoate synthesis regulator phasin
MESPNESMFASVKKLFTDKKERAALEKFRKITSELVQKGAMTFGGRSFTDTRQRLIEQSKASSGLTFEANQYVIENMRHLFDEKKGRAQKDATKLGLQDNYYVPFDPEVFGEILSKGQQNEQPINKSGSSNGHPLNSEQYSEEDILNTAREYGMTPQEVRQKLGK